MTGSRALSKRAATKGRAGGPASGLPPAPIAAARFVLRPVRMRDAPQMAAYTADRRLAEGTRTIPHPLPPGATEAFIRAITEGHPDKDVWVLDGSDHGDASVLGLVSLTRLDAAQSEVAFWVAPDHWNSGLASEAVAAVIAANPHNVTTLCAEVFQDNPGSARVLTNCGFTYLGDAESWSVARAVRVPTWTYLRKM